MRTLIEFIVTRQWDVPLSAASPLRTYVLMGYYALAALFLIMGGFAYQKRLVRFGGYALIGIVVFMLVSMPF